MTERDYGANTHKLICLNEQPHEIKRYKVEQIRSGIITILKVIGWLFGPISILAWFEIKPEAVGQYTYDILIAVLPIIVLASGLFAGLSISAAWSKHRLGMSLNMAEAILKDISDNSLKNEDFSSLTTACKTMLLYAYGHLDGFSAPADIDEFPECHNYLSILELHQLIEKLPMSGTPFAKQQWILTKHAKKYLDEHPETVEDLRAARAENNSHSANRKEVRLIQEWREATYIHKLMVCKALLEISDDTSDHYDFIYPVSLGNRNSSFLIEKESLDGFKRYCYIPAFGIREFFEEHPQLLDLFSENARNYHWVSEEITCALER